MEDEKYKLECTACGHIFEEVNEGGFDPGEYYHLCECPNCGDDENVIVRDVFPA